MNREYLKYLREITRRPFAMKVTWRRAYLRGLYLKQRGNDGGALWVARKAYLDNPCAATWQAYQSVRDELETIDREIAGSR